MHIASVKRGADPDDFPAERSDETVRTELQKASLWKRFAAWMLDGILVCILAVGVAYVLASVLGYDAYNQQLDAAYEQYETQYGIKFDIGQEAYEKLSPQEKQKYDDAYQALIADQEAMHAYQMVMNLTLVIVSIGLLLTVLLLEFAVPLLLKNGQTVGKKVFGLGLMHREGIRINTVQLFARALLGKYTIELMIPVYILLMVFWGTMGVMGTAVMLILLVAQVVSVAVTRTNSALHDLLANTVVVELSSQWIFESREALIEYQKQQHAKAAAEQPY